MLTMLLRVLAHAIVDFIKRMSGRSVHLEIVPEGWEGFQKGCAEVGGLAWIARCEGLACIARLH
jgi:hypothetical protein